MIHVIARIEVVEGRREEFVAAFCANVPNVLAEKGCLEYIPVIDAATDIAAQAPVRDNVVMVVEKWEDLDALKAHLAAPHMAEYRTQVKDLVSDAQIHIMESAG
jgi:quinol monooxygenase YgiN